MSLIGDGDYSVEDDAAFGPDTLRSLMQLAVDVEQLERRCGIEPSLKKLKDQGHFNDVFDRLSQLRGYIARQAEQDNPMEV